MASPHRHHNLRYREKVNRAILSAALLLSLPAVAQRVRTHPIELDFREPQAVLQSDRLTRTSHGLQSDSAVSAESGRWISQPIALDQAYQAIGASWTALNGNFELRIRGSEDGAEWSEWKAVTPGPDTPGSGLVYVRAAFRHLQYELTLHPGTILQDLRLLLIHPGDTPRSELERTGRRYRERVKPFVTSRFAWGSPDGDHARGAITYTKVTHLIVHHTGDSFPSVDYPAWVRAIWAFHVFSNGWIDIGYNFLIDPSGAIYEGRAGGDGALGAHFSCQNGGTMGVALLGTYTNVAPTAEAVDALEDLLAWKAGQLHLDPLSAALHPGTGLVLPVIASHRDGNPSPAACTRTECPGDVTYALLPRLRNDVAIRLKRSLPPR